MLKLRSVILVSLVVTGVCQLYRSREAYVNIQLSFLPDTAKSTPSATECDEISAPTLSRKPKAADGCYHVFLDVGANIGVHGRFLFEPNKYRDATRAKKIFRQQFGTKRDNRDFCVFAMEPNPAHANRLANVSAAYAAMGWRYHVLQVGASDVTETINFYHQDDESHMEWGFTALRSRPGQRAVSVPVIRLSEWIDEEVHGRLLPDQVYGNYRAITAKASPISNTDELVSMGTARGVPKVVMKLDAEGMEMRIFPDLLFSGVLCKALDLVFGEFHFRKEFYPMKLHPSNITIPTLSHGRQLIMGLTSAMEIAQNCKGTLSIGDDESYLADGIPFPVPRR